MPEYDDGSNKLCCGFWGGV